MLRWPFLLALPDAVAAKLGGLRAGWLAEREERWIVNYKTEMKDRMAAEYQVTNFGSCHIGPTEGRYPPATTVEKDPHCRCLLERGGVSLPPSTNSRHSVVRQLAHATGEMGKEDEDAEVAVPTCSARRRGCGSRSPKKGEDHRVVTLPSPSENREGRRRFSLAFVSGLRRRKLEEWTPRPDPPPPSAIDEHLKFRPEDGNGSLAMLGCRSLVVCVQVG
nr:hypothetical protein Iba_chr04cCG14420 [Ipomoea batatas]